MRRLRYSEFLPVGTVYLVSQWSVHVSDHCWLTWSNEKKFWSWRRKHVQRKHQTKRLRLKLQRDDIKVIKTKDRTGKWDDAKVMIGVGVDVSTKRHSCCSSLGGIFFHFFWSVCVFFLYSGGSPASIHKSSSTIFQGLLDRSKSVAHFTFRLRRL